MKNIQGKMKEFWKRLSELEKKKKFAVCGSAAVFICLFTAGIIGMALNSRKEQTLQPAESKAKQEAAITESGNVSIGTSEQSFDLDISEYTATASFSFEENPGGGMMQLFQNGALSLADSSSSGGRTLEIEEVYVTAGQEIEKGTPLLKLSADSVSSIRQELKEDETDAQIIYEQALASEKQSRRQAEAERDSQQAYGEYAETEYGKTIRELSEASETAKEELAQAKEEETEKSAELEEMKKLLEEQKKVLENAVYARDNTSREESLYWWITAVNTAADTKELIQTLEEDIETAEEEIETLKKNIASLSISAELADKELSAGTAEAEYTKELRVYQYENAEEIYSVSVSRSGFETEKAKADYEDAKEKREEFDRVIQDNLIVSEYNGMITEVAVQKGDVLEEGSTLIVLNDYTEASITVQVEETDMEAAAVGSEVSIYLPAFPEETFTGEVTEIGDAEMNSNTNTILYSVVVTVKGDTSGLYEGMSAEVTFADGQRGGGL